MNLLTASPSAPELPLEAHQQNPLMLYCGLLEHLTEQIHESGSLTYKIASWLLIIKILQYLEDHLMPIDQDQTFSPTSFPNRTQKHAGSS